MLTPLYRSVRFKVVTAIVGATLAALLVSAAALLSYEISNYRSALFDGMATQAAMLARMTGPALAFDDDAAAGTNLALLENRPDIIAAAVYAADGAIFARYGRAGAEIDIPAEIGPFDEPRIEGNSVHLFRPVVENGETVGTVYLRARYELEARMQYYLAVLFGVLLVGLLAALLVTVPLQRSVTAPVLAVADAARKVVQERDFQQRVEKTTEDEIGLLVDAFNTMLAEVSDRQRALETSNRRLRDETEERRNAEVALRAADQRKDEFLATLAHELRNPLASMVNAIALMQASNADAGVKRRAQSIIDRQLSHMVRLVDDLLDVSRITRGKLSLRQERVELSSVVQTSVDTARPSILQREQRLKVEMPPETIVLDADPVRLSQVLANLLNNASKYTQEGGNIALVAHMDGDRLEITVSDDGMGIDGDKLDDIFQMFAQAGRRPEDMHSGLGVGLALAKRIAELHGGTLSAASDGPGRGSRFTLALPAAAEREKAAVTPLRAPEPVRQVRHRILLVDDNVDFVESHQILLEALGHEVEIAHDAAGAMAVARRGVPDIAFLDIGLPIVNGYELANRLRALSSEIVLVAMSGWGADQDRRRAHEVGFALHLVKPVELETIRSALGALTPAVSSG
jgi:signal transduction histidine kinase/ActR/RegA family two-component response regulator